MKNARHYFSEEQRQRVNRAVAEAEKKTSAEIVPVVATASGRYDRPEDMVGLWLGMIAMVVAWSFVPTTEAAPGNWGGPPVWLLPVVMVAMAVVGFIVGAIIAGRVGWLRRLFTPVKQMREEVAAHARKVFFDNRIHHTAGATGLLVYVSLYERMAAVLADESILDKLGHETINELCDGLTERLRRLHPAEAISETAIAASDKLAAVLPRVEDDVNELPDALVFLDE